MVAAESPQPEYSRPAWRLLGMIGGSVVAGLRTAGGGIQSDEIGEWAGCAVVLLGRWSITVYQGTNVLLLEDVFTLKYRMEMFWIFKSSSFHLLMHPCSSEPFSLALIFHFRASICKCHKIQTAKSPTTQY